MKQHTAAAAALRAAETALTAASARRDDVLGQCTAARLELAQIERDAEALTASSDAVSVATVRELSQRRAIAEDVAHQLDTIATAAARRTGEAKQAVYQAEREASRAAAAFYGDALAASFQAFWRTNRDRFAELVRIASLADAAENAALERTGPVRRDLAGVMAQEFPARMLELAEADGAFTPRSDADRGQPPAGHQTPRLTAADRDLIAARADALTLGQPPAPPDPLAGWSRDRAQCRDEIAEHRRIIGTLRERLKAHPERATEINAELAQMQARLDRWEANRILLAA